MPIAAIPDYLQKQDLSNAPPGLRFGMYFQGWTHNWEKHVPDRKRNEPTVLASVCKLTNNDKATMKSLAERQAHLAQQVPVLLTLEALATAPFTTGLGNEYPLENGFAFLNPYGLPYLPGSGVKGVLRQAARELASGDWGDTHGWTTDAIHTLDTGKDIIKLSPLDVLFGKQSQDGDTEHLRGVLSFWDALPQVPGDSLAVDIMTPHHSHYYQDGQTPHDSGQPNPISFLTLPPGTCFAFHVRCDQPRLERLAPDLARDDHWQSLLNAAFLHAFSWLGFGAKTAVGYGAMQEDPAFKKRREEEAERLRKDREQAERTQGFSPQGLLIDDFIQKCKAKHQARQDNPRTGKEPLNVGQGLYAEALKLSKAAVDSADWNDVDRKQLAETLTDWLPKLVEKLDTANEWKDARKKLQLARLRGD